MLVFTTVKACIVGQVKIGWWRENTAISFFSFFEHAGILSKKEKKKKEKNLESLSLSLSSVHRVQRSDSHHPFLALPSPQST
jgi:hypothetical protein